MKIISGRFYTVGFMVFFDTKIEFFFLFLDFRVATVTRMIKKKKKKMFEAIFLGDKASIMSKEYEKKR